LQQSPAAEHGIAAESLVAEDYTATQELARRLRASGSPGLVAPSAALPGTSTVVLFGAKVLCPYLYRAVDPEQEPTAHIADAAPAPEVASLVRRRGDDHQSLTEWAQSGTATVFVDPPVPRRF
jgi:hypothetical protein